MGFFCVGNTISWENSLEHIPYVKEHGITQLLNIWLKNKDRRKDTFKFGDEIEYIIIHLDHENKKATLSLRGDEILEELQKQEMNFLETGEDQPDTIWRPEYGLFMIEGIPGSPYGYKMIDLLEIEKNMIKRRKQIELVLNKNEIVLSLTHYPLLGVSDFTTPSFPVNGPFLNSLFVPDEIVHINPRYYALTENIKKRKGKKVSANIPLYIDEKTTEPVRMIDCKEEQKDWHIYCDATVFGLGSCCLQSTYQFGDINESRIMYDQFVVLSPILLSLSSTCPIVRGMLSDHDVRWHLISQSSDDRTEDEKTKIKKSRYSSVSCFINPEQPFKEEYNDLEITKNEEVYERLVNDAKMDKLLAQHFAHLWIRDPLIIYKEKIVLDDTIHNDHFENIQSTNWQTVRFKPPPPNSDIGWRVEVRCLDVQLTDFENAAFVVFVTLVARVIAFFNVNLYIPISFVDQNMEKSYTRGSLLHQKFFWRKSCLNNYSNEEEKENLNNNDDEMVELTVNEIINGCQHFPGFIHLISLYLDSVSEDEQVRNSFQPYLDLISQRASGELMSCASYIRHFVKNHPSYKQDSVVNQQINYDLMVHLHQISSGNLKPRELFSN